MSEIVAASSINLISPSGGKLVNLLTPQDDLAHAMAHAKRLPSIQLSDRALCDLELLAIGAFSPLDRFMGLEDYRRVLPEMRLCGGQIFPIPITLSTSPCDEIRLDREVSLVDSTNDVIGVMLIEEIFEWDLDEQAKAVVGTNDLRHPLVAEMHRWGKLNISGRLKILHLPRHYDFRDLRLTPAETRERLSKMGFKNVVAFQTRNPLHRAHEEMTKRATEEVDGVLLLHPAVGMTKPGDIDHYTRVRSYRTLAKKYYDPKRILLSILPLAMRLAGPREALWHALIRRNYGANHFIVGRDHASPGSDSNGTPFYPPFAAQELVEQFSGELGVKLVSFGDFAYLPEEDRYEDTRKLRRDVATAPISGTLAREWYRVGGANLPPWFARQEVAEVIAQTYPPRCKQGLCVWFTGLSGAGKSTTAEILTVLLQEFGRQVTLLDGDVVRKHLSHGLGFSKEDRDRNILRMGFVASEIVKHQGLVICAAVSPYRATRNAVRNMIRSERFIEVFVDTPLAECERRDTKGMYEKARSGELKNFTGIDDPYEPPINPEILLETVSNSAEQNAQFILRYLRSEEWVE